MNQVFERDISAILPPTAHGAAYSEAISIGKKPKQRLSVIYTAASYEYVL